MTLGYSCIFTRPNAATKFIVGSSLSKCHLLVINEDITTFSWAGREAAGEREAEELKKKQRERERGKEEEGGTEKSLTFCGTFYVNYRPRFVDDEQGEAGRERNLACHADDNVVCPPGR